MRYCLTVCLALLLCLTACSPTEGFEGGRPITPEDLESMSAAFFADENDPAATEFPYTDREPNTYYWTPNGKVYHKYRDCIHLQNAAAVESGGLISARADGRDTPCSACCGE